MLMNRKSVLTPSIVLLADLRFSSQHDHTKLGLNVILTSLFLKPGGIPLQSIRLVAIFLVSKEHDRGIWYLHICNLFVFKYTSRHHSKVIEKQ